MVGKVNKLLTETVRADDADSTYSLVNDANQSLRDMQWDPYDKVNFDKSIKHSIIISSKLWYDYKQFLPRMTFSATGFYVSLVADSDILPQKVYDLWHTHNKYR